MKKWLLSPANIDINQNILEQLVIIYKVWHYLSSTNTAVNVCSKGPLKTSLNSLT